MPIRPLALSAALLLSFTALADEPAPPPAAEQALDVKELAGPRKVDLGHGLTLDLPEGFLMYEAADARKVLERMGNFPDDSLLGMVFKEESPWFVNIRYEETGFVKDDDAAKLDADGLLKDMRDGSEDLNEWRKERGFPPLSVDGWTDPPRYERDGHKVVWSLKVSSAEEGEAPKSSINFNTRVLGRRGYASLNLVTTPETLEASRPEALTLLKSTTFAQGSRYEDFVPATDRVAEFGLAALIAGGAGAAALKVAKVGLLAKLLSKFGVILIAFKKVFIALFIGLGAFLKNLFGRKSEPAAPPPPASSDDNAPPPSA